MRLFVLFILLAPLAHAEAQLSAVEHNITYFLGESNLSVSEEITLRNKPFSVTSPIYYHLGSGAQEISVLTAGGVGYKIDETYGGVIFDFRNAYATKVAIKLHYTFPLSLRRSDGTYLFKGEALKRAYPWGISVVNLRFTLPPGFSFGEVSPEPQESGEGYILYRITYLDARAYQGFPVSIEYAKYSELAEKSLSLAKAREQDTLLAVREANQSIENARAYEANLSEALKSYREALNHLQNYFQLVKQAELLLEENSYEAYRKASSAVEELELAGIRARDAYSSANFAIQHALEKRLSSFEENLSSLGSAEKERVVVVQPAKGTNLYKYAFFALAALFAIFIGSEAYRILAPKSYRRRSSVKDFRVIGDLKRKTFNGFEKKVARVKRGVDLAQEIRSLRKRREKLKLGIENAKKKYLQGEITAELYELEKEKFEREIEEIDRRIALLEKELTEIKRRGHEEGRAD